MPATDVPPSAQSVPTRAASVNPDRGLLKGIARQLVREELGTGALASLRRGDPAIVLRQPTCHRILRDVDDASLDADGALRWATAVHILAILATPGVPWPTRTAGEALAGARFPESRLGRLLASRDAAFRDQAVLATRFLHGRDAACLPLDLAELALIHDRAERRAERLRFRLARDYYREADAATSAPVRS